MMDDKALELGLRALPPADPVYRSRITAMPPATQPLITNPQRRASGRPQPMLTVTRLVATALVVVGAAALYLASSSGPSNLPAASPSPSATTLPELLPAVIPVDVPNGVIQTSIGSARWAHLSGDPTTLPGPLTPLPGPTGLLWFDGGRRWARCEEPSQARCPGPHPQLWWSADAISERVERPLPVDAALATLTALDGTWWLVTSGPTTLWRTTDAERWEQLDLSALVSPGPSGLEWEAKLGLPVTSGGTTVIPVTYVALDSGRLLGRPDLGNRVSLDPTAPGAYRVLEELEGGTRDAGEVRIEETARGLRFSDTAGNTLATLEGVGLEFVDALLEDDAIVEHQFGLVEDLAVTPVPVPGARVPDELGRWGITLFGNEAGFHAYMNRPGFDVTIRTWHSDDGREWAEADPLGNAESEPVDFLLHVDGGSAWGRPPNVVARDSQDAGRAWVSADGETWTAYVGIPGTPMQVGDGWVSYSGDHGWFESRDGRTWPNATELNTVLSKRWTRGGGFAGLVAVIGDTLIYAADEEEEPLERDLWIVEFEGASE